MTLSSHSATVTLQEIDVWNVEKTNAVFSACYSTVMQRLSKKSLERDIADRYHGKWQEPIAVIIDNP